LRTLARHTRIAYRRELGGLEDRCGGASAGRGDAAGERPLATDRAPRLAADGLLEAVRVAGSANGPVADDGSGDVDTRIDRPESEKVHASVGVVVGEPRLGARNRRADVGPSGLVVRAVAEAEVGRDRNREQDPDDDDDDEQLNEGEAFLASDPRRSL
jgi:hypothetical protein